MFWTSMHSKAVLSRTLGHQCRKQFLSVANIHRTDFISLRICSSVIWRVLNGKLPIKTRTPYLLSSPDCSTTTSSHFGQNVRNNTHGLHGNLQLLAWSRCFGAARKSLQLAIWAALFPPSNWPSLTVASQAMTEYHFSYSPVQHQY